MATIPGTQTKVKMPLMLLVVFAMIYRAEPTSTQNMFPPIVYKDIGTMFHHIGSVITSSTNVLTSLFLKLDLPTLEHIKINCGTCTIPDTVNSNLTAWKCIHKDKTISNKIIEGPFNVPTVSSCIRKCLANIKCTCFTYSFTILQPPKCFLRNGDKLMGLKKKGNSYTGDLNCLLKEPSYSCARSDNSLDQIFENAFAETSTQYWKQKLQQLEIVQHTQDNTENLSNINKRKKRQLAAMLPVATTFFSMGFTLFENYKLKKYVDTKFKAFDKFMTNTKEFLEKTIEFESEIVHHIKDLKTYFDFNFKSIICRENKLALQILQRQKLQSWKDTLNLIFQSLNQGDLTGAIPQCLIEVDRIKNLINKNKMLNSTIYKDYPELLTTLGSMTIAGAKLNQGSAFIHVVFSIPTISKTNIHPLYKSEQVGISVNNNCVWFDIPKHVIAIKEILHPIEADTCKRTNNLWICPFHIDKGMNSSLTCLNGTLACPSTIVKCNDHAAYSIAGVLIHSSKIVYRISRHNKDDLLHRAPITSIDLGTHPLQTEFFPWNKYSEIQSAAGTFTALEDSSEVIHIKSYWGSN